MRKSVVHHTNHEASIRDGNVRHRGGQLQQQQPRQILTTLRVRNPDAPFSLSFFLSECVDPCVHLAACQCVSSFVSISLAASFSPFPSLPSPVLVSHLVVCREACSLLQSIDGSNGRSAKITEEKRMVQQRNPVFSFVRKSAQNAWLIVLCFSPFSRCSRCWR